MMADKKKQGFFKIGLREEHLFTFKFRRRHILMIVFIVIAALLGYGFYFKLFMTLPQQAINILSDFPLPLDHQKAMILAPHCDDETLGSAGLMQEVLANGGQVKVVIVTDCNHKGNGAAREKESLAALATLGVTSSHVDFLNLAEAQDELSPSSAEGLQMKAAIKKEIDAYNPTLLIVPHPSDTHKDHRTVGLVTDQILTDENSQAEVAYYLIHFNFLKFPSPRGLHPEDYLTPPARLISSSDSWYKLNLTQGEENTKEDAVLKYKSQLSISNPILHEVLLDFVRRNELFMIKTK